MANRAVRGVFRDSLGNAIASPSVAAYAPGTTTPISIFDDAGTPLANPFTGAATGEWEFYVEPGRPAKAEVTRSGYATWTKDRISTGSPVVDIREHGALVDGSTDDTAAVQAAFTSVPAGGTVLFPQGSTVVTATINVTKSVRVEGFVGAVVDARLPLGTQQSLFNVTADNVTFWGLTIDNANAPAGTLTTRHLSILGNGADDLRILDCQFLNHSRKGAADSGSGGNDSLQSEYPIYVINCNRVWIERCRMHEVSGFVTFVDNCDDVVIRGNRVTMLTASDTLGGLHLETDCHRVLIADNHISGSGGTRTFNGVINVQSNTATPTAPPVCTDVSIIGNLIETIGSFSSGSSGIRLLSVNRGVIRGNVLRAMTGTISYIYADARTVVGYPEQPGCVGLLIDGNIVVAGAAGQRGIHVRNSNAAGDGGEDTLVTNNLVLSDGTFWFALGIRSRNSLRSLRIENNTVHYKYDAAIEFEPWGISVSAADTIDDPIVRGNVINGESSALSRGIWMSAGTAINRPTIDGNIIRDAVIGIYLETSVNNPTIRNNYMRSVTSPIASAATGQTTRYGNLLTHGAARHGTWTISSGTAVVTVNTAEVVNASRITLTVTSNTGNEKSVRATNLTLGVGFNVRTMDGSTVAGDISGTWEIDH